MGRLLEGDCSEHIFLTSILVPGEFHGYPFGKQLTGDTWLALNFILVGYAKNSIPSVDCLL